MKQVLLLTTNSSADSQLKHNLEYLGYEVLCSTQLVEPLAQQKGPLLLNFPIVIFSQTLTNEAVESILKQGQVAGRVLLRCDTPPLNETLSEEWKLLGLTALFSTEEPLASLRELLAVSTQVQWNDMTGQGRPLQVYSITTLEEVTSTFSMKERRLFQILYKEKGTFLTRKEVAQMMWHGEPTSSNLAQLSQIVSRIRLKFARYGFSDQCIETHWKKGYRLSEELLAIGGKQ